MVEQDDGSLLWIPKTVIFEGKEYPAPLDLLPYFARKILLEVLTK